MKFAVPVFFVLGDVSGLVNPQGSVAHLAHIGGFVTGVLLSLIVIRQENVKWPFIYQKEKDEFLKMKSSSSLEKKNFTFLDSVPKNKIIDFISLSDYALVNLKRSNEFKNV